MASTVFQDVPKQHLLWPSTPGPWTIYGDPENWNSTIVAPCGHQVCHLTHNGKNMDGRAAGNLNLIAAAPELLAALRWFVDDIDGTHTKMVEFDQNIARARAAIAKAEGRTP